MLVDAKGHRIKLKTTATKAVVFVSIDEGEQWSPLMPADVPKTVKAPDAMAQMLAGEILETVGGDLYRAEAMQ